MAWVARRCLACLARRQRAMEELDDLAVHYLVHRIAIEAFRVLRGLPGHEFQYPWETRDKRKCPARLTDVFRLRRQRLREALGVIPHEGQVIALRAYTRTANGHLCERVVGEGGGIRRHEHDGAHTRITDIRDAGPALAGGLLGWRHHPEEQNLVSSG